MFLDTGWAVYMIKNIEMRTASLSVTPILATQAPLNINKAADVSGDVSDTATVSLLSRQLSECAARAEARDQSLTRKELGHLAERLQRQFSSEPYTRSNARDVLADTSVSDPVLMERDRQALDYVIRDMHHAPGARNPFAGLSYEQLTLIAYDESDTFTLNERHAAYRAAWEIETQWRMKIGHDSQQGAFTQEPHLFYAEHLAHFRSLPLIDQAQYMEDYEADTESRMLEAAHSVGYKPNDEILTLFDLIAGAIPGKDGKKKESLAEPQGSEAPVTGQLAVKTSSLSPDVSPTPAGAVRS
ncbi:hypothetical protein [Pseudomonas sp. NPDC089734]|uniref:hypothetical protein n=1 Tax=Pseudomonas sp. NPDC089734 TaxID=3364469 RepID=UPI0037FA7CA6